MNKIVIIAAVLAVAGCTADGRDAFRSAASAALTQVAIPVLTASVVAKCDDRDTLREECIEAVRTSSNILTHLVYSVDQKPEE